MKTHENNDFQRAENSKFSRTKKNDFIELEFTAHMKGGQVFDTTMIEEAKKAGLVNEEDIKKEEIKERFKPMKLCIGQGQVNKGFDKALEEKEPEKDYEIEIQAKDAYGPRDSKLIRPVPLTAFQEMPQQGMFVNVNGMIAKVISITGGRVLIDMNNPLAGKDLVYKFKILEIITDTKEKINALLESANIKTKSIELDETGKKAKIGIEKKLDEKAKKAIAKKMKEILDLDAEFLETLEKPEKTENKEKSLEKELGDDEGQNKK